MIELREVDFAYDDSDPTVPVLDRVDLRIEEGDLVVVAGRTGVGKSTLLGVIAGLVPRYSGGTLCGDVVLDGRSILQAPPRERAHLVGYVAQDPAAGFVTDTVEEELAYGMEQLGVAPSTMRRRVEETLDLLGVADLRSRDLRTLSGGQQQRVAIGSVLTMHQQLLVLDEPTSALDPTAAEDVLATLARLVDDLGLSILVAEHRLERVLPFADRVAVLDGGRLRVGPPPEVLAESPVAPPIVELGRLLGWHPLPMSVREARRAARGLSIDAVPQPDAVPGAAVLQARAVSVTRGRRVVLREVDLDVSAGSVTAVMGRNGSGKSTLLWTLQGGLVRTTGRVALGADDPAALSPAQRRARIGLVPQTADDLLYLETVREECAAADEGAGAASGTCRETLDALVPGIADDTHPRDLSQGQRLALVLAIVLSARPSLVLLDEPTRGLDYDAKEHLAASLRGLAADGRGVLVATHDVEFVARVADRVVVLADGEVVSSGPVREVVVESPSFAPQVTKILGAPWLRVDEVARVVLQAAEAAEVAR